MTKYAVRIEWTMDKVHFVEAATPEEASDIARGIPIDYAESNHLGMNIAEIYDESNGEKVLEI
jgi:hypothetical protein